MDDGIHDMDSKVKSFPVSWGTGLKVFLTVLIASLILPVLIILLCIPQSQVPVSMLNFAVVMLVTSTVVIIPILFLLPDTVDVSVDEVRLKTLCKFTISSCKLDAISRISKVRFREFCSLKSVGFPTDWSKTIALHISDSYTIVVSPQDPDTFINRIISLSTL